MNGDQNNKQNQENITFYDQVDAKTRGVVKNATNRAEAQVRENEDASLQDDSYSFDEDNTADDDFHDVDEDFRFEDIDVDFDNDEDFVT